MELGGLGKISEDWFDDVSLENIQMMDSGVQYHPDEIIFWKYGEYLAAIGNINEAIGFMSSALTICWKHQNYLTLNVTGLGIAAERIVLYCQIKNKKAAKNAYRKEIMYRNLILYCSTPLRVMRNTI